MKVRAMAARARRSAWVARVREVSLSAAKDRASVRASQAMTTQADGRQIQRAVAAESAAR
jgi:hypothetical protein